MRKPVLLSLICLMLFSASGIAQGTKNTYSDCLYHIRIRKFEQKAGVRHLDNCIMDDYGYREPFWAGFESDGRDVLKSRTTGDGRVMAIQLGYQQYLSGFIQAGFVNFNPSRHIGTIPLPTSYQLNLLYNMPFHAQGYELMVYNGVFKHNYQYNDQFYLGASYTLYRRDGVSHQCIRPLVGVSGRSGILSNFILFYGYTFGGASLVKEGEPAMLNNGRHMLSLVYRVPIKY